MDLTQITIAIISLLGGGVIWNIYSTIKMPKKEEREADQQFIQTLLDRVNKLEARIEEQSKQISNLMASNATLSVELNYIKAENEDLKEELKKYSA